MTIKILTLAMSLFALGAFVALPTKVLAQSTQAECEAAGRVWIEGPDSCVAGEDTGFGGPCEPPTSIFDFPTWYQYLDSRTDSSGRCQPVIEGAASILPIGVAVLDIMLRLGGILAVIFVIVGGVKYIISQGDPDRAKSARNTIVNALIGIAITIVSAPIVRFIGDRFGDRP